MLSMKNIRSGKYLASLLGKPFARGTNDCMTMFLGWHDYVYGTDLLKTIYNKYNDTRSAAVFWQRNFPGVRQQLHTMGFKQTLDTPRDLDLAINETSLFPSAYILYDNEWYGIDEGSYAGVFDLEDADITIWRKR